MKRDNTLILTDFNNDLILNFIKSKKKSFKLKSKYYDNLLINFDQNLIDIGRIPMGSNRSPKSSYFRSKLDLSSIKF